MARLGVRRSEWVLIAFFAYAALLIPWFRDRPHVDLHPVFLLVCVCASIAAFAIGEEARLSPMVSYLRDWLPLALTLFAFSEMQFFVPTHFDLRWERIWIGWDERFLVGWHVRAGIESLGKFIPFYLELCYLLVYGVGIYCVLLLYINKKRSLVDRFFVIYLTGTLLSYALFPYFPSLPPRTVFPAAAAPHTMTWMRWLNLRILGSASVQSGIFPSAHVSSAFSAAWAMFLLFPRRKIIGGVFTFYAVSVAIATIYGRYHYAADAAAGFGISLVAALIYLAICARRTEPVAAAQITKS